MKLFRWWEENRRHRFAVRLQEAKNGGYPLTWAVALQMAYFCLIILLLFVMLMQRVEVSGSCAGVNISELPKGISWGEGLRMFPQSAKCEFHYSGPTIQFMSMVG